jgi:trimeric autotransporter adhesin
MEKITLVFATFLLSHLLYSQNVGIGTNTPDASALLELNATNKGLLIPRITLLSPTDNVTVTSPANGLLIYNNNSNTTQMPGGPGFYVWKGAWIKLMTNEPGTSTGAWTTTGNAGTDPVINFLGTTDNKDLVFRRNNIKAGFIDDNQNTSLGINALPKLFSSFVTGVVSKNNTVIGFEALKNEQYLDSANTAIGVRALSRIDGNGRMGSFNTAVGYYAGGSDNQDNLSYRTTIIGANAGGIPPVSGLVPYNATLIGYGAQDLGGPSIGQNSVTLGNTEVDFIGGIVGFSSLSDARIKDSIREDVPGLDFIRQLHPVTYYLNVDRVNSFLYHNADKMRKPAEKTGKYEIEKIKMSGFLSQEVEKAAQKIGYDFSGVSAPKSENGLYTMRYTDFIMPLVKAVQEQQALIESQQNKYEQLLIQLEKLSEQNILLLQKITILKKSIHK